MQLDIGSTERDIAVVSCPYCDATGPCEHRLVSVDLTFVEALGGPLSDWVSSRLEEFRAREEIEEDFCESDALQDILEDVLAVSDGERDEDLEGGPGMSSSIRHFYCATEARVQAAVGKLKASPTVS